MEYYSSLDASQLDRETPTIFEIISSAQLESLLSPSLRYVLVHYASKYPYYLLGVANNFDELNLLLRGFIEWYFFKYWQGSFTENFYGLKRVAKTKLNDYNSSKLTQLVPGMIEKRRQLSTVQRWGSIFEVVGSTYIAEKLNYWYELWYPKYITNQLVIDVDSSLGDKIRIKAKIWFVKWFPYIQSAIKLGNLLAMLTYLNGTTKSPGLISYLLNINFSRLNQYDYDKNDPLREKRHFPNRVSPPSTLEWVLSLLTRYGSRPLWRTITLVMGTIFPVLIFALKFLEWWNNSHFNEKLKKSDLPSLPPPKPLTKPQRVYRSGKTCPLCKQEISNPAIIETGYVFCYSCIYQYLASSHLKNRRQSDSQSDSQNESNSENEGELEEKFDIEKGGRCPITGTKLLGCKWNSLKNEWEINNIRKVIF